MNARKDDPLLGLQELAEAFRERMPGASEEEVAAALADFLEQVPPDVVETDDGVLREPVPEDAKGTHEWVQRLREFAGRKRQGEQ